MNNLIKGFIIGIGKILPGVSGALLAILMGVYDKSIDYIINFKRNKKESIKYLFPIGIGILLSIILFSKVIYYTLNKYYFEKKKTIRNNINYARCMEKYFNENNMYSESNSILKEIIVEMISYYANYKEFDTIDISLRGR